MAIEKRDAEIAGARTAWLERQGARGPVMALHCTLSSSAQWAPLAARLGDDVGFLAPDLPGHGGTEHAADTDLQAQSARAAAQIVDGFGAGPAHVLGHSFGATVAMRMARDYPEAVKSLILFEPVLFGLLADTGHAAWEDEARAQDELTAAFDAGPKDAAKLFVDRWGHDGGWDAVPAMSQTEILDRIDVVAKSAPSIAGSPATGRVTADDLREIEVPVTIMRSEGTQFVIHAIHSVIAERMNILGNHMIMGAGHMAPMTHPDRIATAVLDMMEQA